MATLSGNKIKNTYQALVKFSDNGNITTSAKQLTDGFGNNSPIWVSTTQVGIGVTPESGLNLHVYGDAKIGSNLTVIGNLVVEGSTTTVGTDTLTVKDPLIVLANNNTSTDAVDIGFYGKYTPSGTTLYSGLFREALTGKYRLFKGLETEPTTTVNTSGTGYTAADLVIGNLQTNGLLEESTQFKLTKDIRIFDSIPAITLQDSDSSGSASLGDIQWLDNAASQRAIISLSNAVLGITSKHGGLNFATDSTTALTIDASQNSTFAGLIESADGSAAAPAYSFSSDTDTGIYKAAANTIGFSTAGSNVVTMTSQYVGIGNVATNPLTWLHVKGNHQGVVTITQEDNSFTDDTYSLYIDNALQTANKDNSGAFAIDVEAGRAFTVTGNGKIGINKTRPTSFLDVAGTGAFTGQVTAPTFLGDLNGTINTLTTAVTQSANNNSTKVATTAYADAAASAVPIGDYLPLAGGTLTGNLSINQTTADFIDLTRDLATDQTWRQAISGTGSFSLYDVTRGADVMVIDTLGNSTFAGNVGIGSAPGSYKLDVTGNGRFSGFFEMAGGGAVYQGQKFYLDGGGDTFLESPSSNIMTFTTNAVEKMRIDSSGNLSLGTVTPFYATGDGDLAQISVNRVPSNGVITNTSRSAAYVNINGSDGGSSFTFHTSNANNTQPTERMAITSGGALRLTNEIATNSKSIDFTNTAGTTGWAIGNGITAAAHQFVIYDNTAGLQRFKIDSSGNVLIGTNSIAPATQDGFVLYPQGTLHLTRADDYVLYLNRRGSDGVLARMVNDGVVVGGISVTGSSTTYNTSSDYRLKEDLQDFAGLDMVSKIPVYDFKWKTDESRSYGVMAHELQEVLPDAVVGKKDAEEMQGVDYSKIVPLLVKSIQELEAKIKKLENK